MNKYTIDQLIRINFSDNTKICYYNVNSIISNAYNISKKLNKLITKGFELYNQYKDSYYEDLRYFKRFGGIFPTNYHNELLEELKELKEIRNFIIDSNREIIKNRCYEMSFKLYLEDISSILDYC